MEKTKKRMRSAAQQTFSSLRVRNFRLFIIGQGISLCGTWVQVVAMGWLVLQLTHSGTQLGFILAAQFLPMLLFGVWGGVIADRLNKRKVLYFTQSIAGLLALTLGILVLAHLIQLWMIYVLAVGLGFTQAIDTPTRQSFFIEMVGAERVKNAVTLNAIIVNIGRIIGPSLAGLLIATVGIGPCFIVNALSFGAVLISLLMMRSSELIPVAPVPKERGQIRAGLRYAWSVPEIRACLVMMLIVGTLTYEFPVILPLFATLTFKGGASTYSALTAFMSFGAMLGGFYAASKGAASMQTIVRVSLCFGLAIILTALMPTTAAAFAALIAVGVLSILFVSLTNSTLQLTTVPEMRGRVMSLMGMAFLGTTPIGGPIIGFISDHSNPRVGLMVGGLAAIVAAGVGWRISRSAVKLSI